MIAALDRPLAALRRRALLAAWSAELGRELAPALFALGCVVLAGRFAFDVPRGVLAWAAAPLALLPVCAWLRARPRFLSRAGTAAWLDVRTGGSGAVLTAFAVDDAPFSAYAIERARAAALPRVRCARHYLASLPALFFVAGAFWLEPSRTPGPPTRVVAAALERVREQLAALQEVVELPEEEADELDARLQRIAQELGEARPESSYEALDRVEEQIAELARQALEDGRRANEGLAAAAAPGLAGEAAQAALEAALAELRESGLDKGLAAGMSPSLQGTLDAGALRLPPGAKLDAAQLAELSKELRGLVAGRLDALARAGLLEAGELELAKLDGFEFKDHECDEECKRGGT